MNFLVPALMWFESAHADASDINFEGKFNKNEK